MQYFYILNQITLKDDCHIVYAPSTNTQSEYLTKTIDDKLIDIIIPQVAFFKKDFQLLSVRRWSDNTAVV